MADYPTRVLKRANGRASRSGSSRIADMRGNAQSGGLHVNTLPTEVLSYIFTVGEQAERFAQAGKNNRGVRFPEVVSQVCSHWRTVATNNPALWTWVTVAHPSHRETTALFLTRAGSTALLDIGIEMRSGFWDRAEISTSDWKRQLEYTSDLLEFLIACGAGPGRWRTLSFWARQPEPLFEVIAFLHQRGAPVLRSLSLRWASKGMQSFEEGRAIDRADMSLLSGPTIPNLRSVELTSFPWAFVLRRPSPLFTGLTSLSLTAATRLHSTTKLIALLRGNPSLDLLELGSGSVGDWDVSYLQNHPPQLVPLPSLRSLSVRSKYNRIWILDVLQSIQTPNLEKFTLATELYADSSGAATGPELLLLGYLFGGSSNGGFAAGLKVDSIYPSLRELDFSRVECYSGRETIVTLLSSFASVTRLSIASHHISCLGRFPWVLPKLRCLTLKGDPNPDLGSVLRRRANAGYPIQMVELGGDGTGSWDQEARDDYISALPHGVTVSELPYAESSSNDESDVEGWEDEVDDEDVGGYPDTEDEWMEGAELDLYDNDHDEYENHEEYENQEDQGEYEEQGYSEGPEEYQDDEEYVEEQGHEESDEYDGAGGSGYYDDIYLPTCWIEVATGATYEFDFDAAGYPYEWPFMDQNLFSEGEYSDGGRSYDGGHYEDGGWAEYDSEGDGGSDLEGRGSDFGGYDFDDSDGYGYDYGD